MVSPFIADWDTYLSVQAEAAATLTGLVFVAVSINITRILSTPGLVGRAAESILQLFGVPLVTGAALIPRQSLLALGIEILTLGLLLWILETIVQVRYLMIKAGHPRWWGVLRIFQTQLSTIPFCIAGILLCRSSLDGLYWLVPGCVFSMISGVANAWVLLIEILR